MRYSVALALLAACGGRSLDGSDAGDDAGDEPDGTDGDADTDGDSDVDGGGYIPCPRGASECPWDLPYCCWEDAFAECLAEPEWNPDSSESGCTERIEESRLVPFDCFRQDVEPELCPDAYPHCCIYGDDQQEVCVDHLPVGWRCDD